MIVESKNVLQPGAGPQRPLYDPTAKHRQCRRLAGIKKLTKSMLALLLMCPPLPLSARMWSPRLRFSQ